MKINWDDLKVDFSHIDIDRFLESWEWLVGKDKTIFLITSIGDAFLKDKNNLCYWLNVGEGCLEKIADSMVEFNRKLEDENLVDEWFLLGLVEALKDEGLKLVPKKLYGYKKLPVFGGEYKPANFELTDIEVHFELAGQFHRQIKDLPDGTKVNIVIK